MSDTCETHIRPYAGYKLYTAMKLHFNTLSYDIFASEGKVWCKPETFDAKNDVASYIRLTSTIPKNEIMKFLLANFVGQNFDLIHDLYSGGLVYREWQKRIDSLSEIFKNDLTYLMDTHKPSSIKELMVSSTKSFHPLLLKAFIGGYVCTETMCILEAKYGYVEEFDKFLGKDILWKKKRLQIVKYLPFFERGTVRVNEQKIEKILLDIQRRIV